MNRFFDLEQSERDLRVSLTASINALIESAETDTERTGYLMQKHLLEASIVIIVTNMRMINAGISDEKIAMVIGNTLGSAAGNTVAFLDNPAMALRVMQTAMITALQAAIDRDPHGFAGCASVEISPILGGRA